MRAAKMLIEKLQAVVLIFFTEVTGWNMLHKLSVWQVHPALP